MKTLRPVRLEDKYTLESGHVFLTGIQALVRLPMMQRRRDLAAGFDTAGYISGYRGSPLGGYDQQLFQVRRLLEEHHIRFQPGVNEDLAATAVWGTQQAGLHGEGKYAGVFAIWYGKGPGVDRSGDAFRHGNLAGSSPLGGVLVLMGDDHTCESSTTAHQSEYALVDAMIPILNPAGVQEILDLGLYGWALSRYSGCWVGMKCVHDTVNTAASVHVDPARVQLRLPEDHALPAGGLNIRWPDHPRLQEARLHNDKIEAVRAFCRANGLDRVIMDSPAARIGIVTTGKSYLDVRSALDDLGIDRAAAARLGVRVYKVAVTWPLEPLQLARFAAGLDLIITVEEKRGLVEAQIKELLYHLPGAPRVIGKTDERGQPLFVSSGALDANYIASLIGHRILDRVSDDALSRSVASVDALLHHAAPVEISLVRQPHFCAGCPHNTSTRVPDGSRAVAGIGCSFMAMWMERGTAGFTQMGGEGAGWIGEAAFSKRPHVFQNIGDGTYFHSGLLAIRAAAAAGVNITFKILYNDAVAMTGGQPVDGPLTVPQITRQVHAEGAQRIVVVTDEPQKYGRDAQFAPGVQIYHRDALDVVQRELREIEGMTVLVYDQTCAAEKRRRRKRGKFPDPPMRPLINEAVCEGCGDCGVKSNCVAVLPLETEFGRKRAIDQSACNKDFSCLKGFCPSFVTVHGGELRRRTPVLPLTEGAIPDPAGVDLDRLGRPYGIVVTGVGGTGVVTIGALLGMAAHLEGKGCGILDMTGLAQKGGAVTSHIRIAVRREGIQAVRLGAGGADLLLGGDILVSGGRETVILLREGRAQAVVNTYEMMTGDFTRNADFRLPATELREAIEARAGQSYFIDATRLATALLGDSIATSVFLTGYAYQKGLLPVSAEALERAIELNGAAVEMNKRAFLWGRHAAVDLAGVEKAAIPAASVPESERLSGSLEELIERRAVHLTRYQSSAYANRYRRLVGRVREAELRAFKGRAELTAAVARYYAKLLAYKDEYEVARLYTDGEFERRLEAAFEGDFKLSFHLAPPFLARRDPHSGEPVKRTFGPWMLQVFRALAKFKVLRGTPLDVFGYSVERKTERRLIADYERLLDELIAGLNPENHSVATELASLPEYIRGFGHVKARHLSNVKKREAELLALFRAPAAPVREAA
jgi:indolepyruvate ferredoxin oxidoreductase